MLTNDEIKFFISEDEFSEKKRLAKKGQNYYEGKHDIENYRLFYFDGDGILKEDKYRSNVKIPHPFFTEIVNQSVQYIFSGERFVKSHDAQLQSLLDDYFNYNEHFTANLSEVVTGCIVKGFEYMYMFRNRDGRLEFQAANSLGIIEVSSKNSIDGGEYLIYYYIEKSNRGKKKIKRIQIWDKNQIWFYTQDSYGNIRLDDQEVINPRPHILYSNGDGKTYYDNFGMIPFFRLDNNLKQQSDLMVIKDLIDDYDLMASSLSNNLIDFDMPLYAVTGFEGNDLDQLQTNLKSKKIIGLDEGGNVDIKTVDVPYQARLTKLELDEKNIYRFGMGLNTAGLRDTSATTNIAIKAAYSLLDLKCAKLETRIKQFLRRIIKPVIIEINTENNTSYGPSDVFFEFKHVIMSNALENARIDQINASAQNTKINTIINLSDVLDDETIFKIICDNLDIDYMNVKDKLSKPIKKAMVNKSKDSDEEQGRLPDGSGSI